MTSTSAQRQIQLLKLIEQHTEMIQVIGQTISTQHETIDFLNKRITALEKRGIFRHLFPS